jgi:hypothetical protein
MSDVESGKAALALMKEDAESFGDVCYQTAERWKKIYYASRISLIVFSALTTAQALATVSSLRYAQAVFATLVSVITAVDLFLRPGAVYRAQYIANDDYAEVRQDIISTSPTDSKKIEELKKRFQEINRRLQKQIMPA